MSRSLSSTVPNSFFPPPPRSVRRRDGKRHLFIKLLCLLFVCVPFILIGVQLAELYVHLHGRPVRAYIFAKRYSFERYRGRVPKLEFRYTDLDGKTTIEKDQEVTEDEYERAPLNNYTSARTGVVLGIHVAALDLAQPSIEHPFFIIVEAGDIMLVVFGIISYRNGPLRQRRLIQSGSITSGQPVGWREAPGERGIVYKVSYQFTTPNGVIVEKEQAVKLDDYTATQTNRLLHIFYDPANPKRRHTAYELSLYEIVN